MAIGTQTLSDGESITLIKLVGDASGSETTTINVSALGGASGDGDERVKVIGILFSISGDASNNDNVLLEWDAAAGDVEMLRLAPGTGEWNNLNLLNNSGGTATGDIVVTGSASFPFTLMLTLKKIAGFTGTAITYRQVAGKRHA
tara:strand:+ start:776 stop:1210 length:435 start_codon:yes stop_codon:yes gene_type:complete